MMIDAKKAALLIAVVAATTSCSGDLGSGPQTTYGNIRYTAAVQDISGTTTGSTAHQFSVFVTLTNKIGASQTRTYPVNCPVLIRLYRQSDQTIVYDETRSRDCSTTTATVTIPGTGTAQLQSGVRFPSVILGDSLPKAVYNAKAALLTEGSQFLIIDAGLMDLSK